MSQFRHDIRSVEHFVNTGIDLIDGTSIKNFHQQQEENMMVIHQFLLLFSRSGSSISSSSTTVPSESVSVSTANPKANRGETEATLELLDLSQVTFRTTIAELCFHFSFYSAPSKSQIFLLIYPLVILNDCSTIVDLKESIRQWIW